MNDVEDPLEDVDVQNATLESVDHDAVREGLRHDEQQIVWRAISVCDVLAAEDISHIDPFLAELLALLSVDNAATTQRAGGLLFARAKDDPTLFTDHVGAVVDLFSFETGGHRNLGANILAKVVLEEPGAIAPHFDEVVAATEGTDVMVHTELPDELVHEAEGMKAYNTKDREETALRFDARNKLVNVLVAVVEEEPAAVADDVPDVAALLDHDDEVVVSNAIDALAAYAEHDPALVEDHVDALIACLDHEDEQIRARTIRALGFAEATGAVDALRTVAEDDEDEDVSEMAAETADFLETA